MSGESLAMAHEVIMPALGMAQDTGLLVAWHKAVGDRVLASDILMEVETDKSVMEVEAGSDGFIVELRAGAGTSVPVGQVIAVIASSAGAVAIEKPVAAKTKPVAEVNIGAAAIVMLQPPPPPVHGRILASPKAKRLAAEQGLDLAQLAKAGVAQPYHVADLQRLKALPAAASAPGQSMREISARVGAQDFMRLGSLLEAHGGDQIQHSAIWAAFAAAGLREQTQAARIVVKVTRPITGEHWIYVDPDRERFSNLHVVTDESPDLLLYDFTQSRITAIRGSAPMCPVLSVGLVGESFDVTLSFGETQLSDTAAYGVLDGFAARLGLPLSHLL